MGEEDPYYFTLVADGGPSNASVMSAGRDTLPSKKPQESEGLLRWKAPETLVYGKCTTKSDVWYVLYVQAYMDYALHIYHVEIIAVANMLTVSLTLQPTHHETYQVHVGMIWHPVHSG